MVTLETIAGLTRRIVRQKLESEFVLAENSLLARKKEIDQIVEEVVANLQTGEERNLRYAIMSLTFTDGEGTGDGSNTTPNDVKPGQKRGAGRSNGKRSHESEDAEDFSDDSSDTEEAIEKSSGSAVTAAGATGKRAVGFRKAQASIMTRTYFIENAKPLESNLGPIEFTAQPREFKTGSCGWFFNCKRELDVGGTSVHCQVTVNCTGKLVLYSMRYIVCESLRFVQTRIGLSSYLTRIITSDSFFLAQFWVVKAGRPEKRADDCLVIKLHIIHYILGRDQDNETSSPSHGS